MSTRIFTEDTKRGNRSLRISRIEIDAGEAGKGIVIDGFPFTVTCIPQTGSPTGSGKIQYTTSLPSLIESGEALWIDWSRGEVSDTASDVPEGPVSGIRGVSISEALVLEVVQ